MNNFKNMIEKFSKRFSRAPRNREELLETLREAEQQQILDSESEGMLEGVLQVSQMQIRDIMIPRSQMVVVEKQQTIEEVIDIVLEAMHSRYPVIGEHRDDVEGILLAKDLLRYTTPKTQAEFSLRKIMQPTMIVPETQHLDKLLQEFKNRRSHMAIVVDEYAHVAGLITMEDVLEQIVGDIEDESDYDEEEGIKQIRDYYVVKADISMEEFNEYFKSFLDDDDYETVGGFVLHHLGHIPKRNEEFNVQNFHFKVLYADKRRIRLLQVNRLIPSDL